MRSFAWWMVVILVLVMVAGCNDEQSEVDVRPERPAQQPTDESLADSTFSLGDLDSNLVGLERRQVVVSADFQAGDGSANWQLVSDHMRLSDTQVVDVAARGALLQDAIGSFKVTRVGQETYLEAPIVGCLATTEDSIVSILSGPLDPDFFLANLSGAQLSEENVLINGAITQRYAFDQAALPKWEAQSVEISGDVYVDGETGLLRKAKLTLAGQADYLDREIRQDGTLSVTIDVLEVGPEVTISAPATCLDDASYPRVQDAFDVTRIDELLTYRTRLSMAEVIAFYEAEMPALGWQAEVDEQIFVDGTALLTYRRGQEQVVVTIEQDQASDAVSVVVGP